jgi:hypothetical protein
MSAGLTHDQVEVTEQGGVVTRLGYLHCLDCWGDQSLADSGARWSKLSNLVPEADCDLCGKHVSQTRPLTFTAVVVIEHVTCKIF